MHTPEIVLLGRPNSGKTHYAGQLYGRLQRNPGLLKLRNDKGTPADLSALEEVLRCLENGHAADHTSAGTWVEVLFPLEDERGNAMDLRWPDYGGEKLDSIFTEREAPEAWWTQLRQAEGWLLLIRLKSETTYPDALAKLVDGSMVSNGIRAQADNWDANAYWVELLQILLHIAGVSTVSRCKQPNLAVLLSCYDDEVETDDLLPHEVLAKRLPLVAAFINSLWTPNAVSIWGLAALGCTLEPNSENESFINEGAEYQGWIITPEGQKDTDLSRPLAWLLEAK